MGKDVKSSSEAKRIPMQHFVRKDEEDAVEKREAVSVATSLPCQVARASTVTTLKATDSTPPIFLDIFSSDLNCEPVPVRVKLISADGHYYPTYITLHRCMGSCGPLQAGVKQCEVVQEQEIKYGLMKASYDGSFEMVEIK